MSPEEQFKIFIHKFLKTDNILINGKNEEYKKALRCLYDKYKKIYERNYEKYEDVDDSEIEDPLFDREGEFYDLYYYFSLDHEISEFYFLRCYGEDYIKSNMIISCILMNNIGEAYNLIDLLIETKYYPKFSDINGWSHEIILVVDNIINSLWDKKILKHSDDIEKLIDEVIPDIPNKVEGKKLKLKLLKAIGKAPSIYKYYRT